MWTYIWGFESLKAYVASFYRIPVIFHDDVDAMAPAHLMQLTELIQRLPWEKRVPLLSAGGVKIILTTEKLSIPDFHQIAKISNRSNLPFYLYQNGNVARRVEFVTDWKFVESDDEALRFLLEPTYNPKTSVVLQPPVSSFFEYAPQFTPLQEEKITSPHTQKCTILLSKIHSTMYSASFSVKNVCDGYLVFSEPYYPGWRISIDGKLSPILRANYAFSAVFLETGEHHVKWFYRPNSLHIGILSSIFWGCILIILTYKGWLIQ
jgi:hypothetical protein